MLRNWPQKTSNCVTPCMCNFQIGKTYETEESGCLELGVREGINCKGPRGELLWADGNVLKLDCKDGCTTL